MALRIRTKPIDQRAKLAANAGLTLYVAPRSVLSDWLRLVLAEKEVEDARVETVLPGKPHEDFLVLNPAHVLPAACDREGVWLGARVIAEYLDERYPHPPLMPAAPAGRARVRMALAAFEQELVPLLDGPPNDPASGERLRRLRVAARRIPAQGWLLGREYTLADCAWAALLRAIQAQSLESSPANETLTRYAARLRARPAYQRCFEQ
ncbi:MAG: glutathione S-transferase N-terminal domain-containing protein [Sinobacteraceae bacterium]|nr:glutathione S-transferase N-terminal domain-containing protein [Nevskiaceae bacterium]